MSHVPPRRGKRKGTLSALNDQNEQAKRMRKNKGKGGKDDAPTIDVSFNASDLRFVVDKMMASYQWGTGSLIWGDVAPPPAKLTLPTSKQTGGIHGFRAWRIAHDERGVGLQSAHVHKVWDGPILKDETPPEDGYVDNWHAHTKHHGIYAARSFTPLDYDNASVYGEVLLWGKVVVHEHGYRGQNAMIRRLVVVDHFALLKMPSLPDLLARRYGCEVSTDIRSLLTEA